MCHKIDQNFINIIKNDQKPNMDKLSEGSNSSQDPKSTAAIKSGDTSLKAQTFDKRQDVLNKTMLRSLKKFLTKEFYKFSELKSLPYKERTKKFFEELDSFTSAKYRSVKEDPSAFNFSYEDISYYTGIIIWPEIMKKKFKAQHKFIKFNKNFYECVYRYSHIKLSKMFCDDVLKYMFEDYIGSGCVYQMIQEDETLRKNEDLYKSTVKIFEESFAQSRYINI